MAGPSPSDSLRPVTVGVTGHRILAEVDRIAAGIREAFGRIEAAHPGRPIVLLSPLAEGADRLAAHAVLEREGGRLIAPLPLAEDDFLQDFATPESKAEFRSLLERAEQVIVLPPAETRNASYGAGGNYVVDRSEVLLAIWDGQGAQGQGGTGEVVARARVQGKPVVIVRAGNRSPGTQEPTSLGPEQGRVITQGLPE
jgi:hypothetical protein